MNENHDPSKLGPGWEHLLVRDSRSEEERKAAEAKESARRQAGTGGSTRRRILRRFRGREAGLRIGTLGMSLLNVSVLPDRVLMAVDTTGEQVKDGRRVKREISKMLPLVHLGTMVGVCGNTAMAIAVVQLAMIGPAKTFDELVPLIKPITEAAFRSVSREAKANKTPVIDQQVIAFAGWSEADCAPAAFLCTRNAQHALTVSRVVKTIFCPGAEQLPERNPAEQEYLVVAARTQVDEVHAKHPHIPIGGRLLVADIARSSMSVFNYGEL